MPDEGGDMEQLKPDEALAQISYLRDIIEETKERAAYSWWLFVIWGITWTIGYVITAWVHSPRAIGFVPPSNADFYSWWALVVAALIATTIVGNRMSSPAAPTTTLGRRINRINLILLVATGVFLFVAQPTVRFASAYWPFWIGVMYLVNAVLLDAELYAFGAWLIGAALVSLLMPVWIQALFLAACGGGAFIVTGFLFHRQLRSS